MPYRVLVSEILLQRTRADNVVPVYLKLMQKYPKPCYLATANTREITRIIRPLGLRYKAKRLLQTAKIICNKYGGVVPDTLEELLSVHGIGGYIARAVLVFGYGQRYSTPDPNFVRVVSRFLNLDVPQDYRKKKRILRALDGIVPETNYVEFNYGVIDIGSLYCKPGNPNCTCCPLRKLCVLTASDDF